MTLEPCRISCSLFNSQDPDTCSWKAFPFPGRTPAKHPDRHGRHGACRSRSFQRGRHQFRVVIAPQGRVSKHANGTLRLHKVCFSAASTRAISPRSANWDARRQSCMTKGTVGQAGLETSVPPPRFLQAIERQAVQRFGPPVAEAHGIADESGNAPKKDDPVQLERWLGQVLDIRKDLLAGLAAMNHNASLHRQLHEIIVPVLPPCRRARAPSSARTA